MEEKEDLRVVRTKKMLCEALTSLLETTSYEKINVIDICEKAMVHRATFYNHFNDKEMLLDYMLYGFEEELFNSAINSAVINSSKDEKELYLNIISKFIDFATLNKKRLYLIFKHSKDKITSLITSTFKKCISFIISKNKFRTEYLLPINVLVTFFTGGITAIGIDWLESTNPPSKEEMLNYFEVIINPAVYAKNIKN